MNTTERPTQQATTTPEKFTQAATAIGDTVARAGAYIPELSGGLADLVRRHPLPSIMVGLGLGFLLGRSCARTADLASEAERIDQPEAGYPDALIQCLQCGQMIRQADMVSHSTACRGSEFLSHGGSPS